MDVDPDSLLNVKETAQQLGVHENTVRNWAREGVLPSARVPGSRFLRFRQRDVKLLIAQRGAPVPSLQVDRRAANPEFVTANHLKQWPSTESRDAQENFPELMRRLLVETGGITNISIRSGDGIALSGFDGVADSTGTDFLPAGELVFEFGVDERPSVKATSDYNDRVSDVPSPKVFIFATPRRWAGKQAWAEERRREGHFADVRVLDADDLEGWLRTAPGALYWISEHLGLHPRDAVSLDTWWERFSRSTNPPLPADLFLAGRQQQVNELIERLNKSATLTVIESEWTDDCLAFVYASLNEQADGIALLDGTAIVVSSVQAWDSILEQPGEAVLIPTFVGADVALAIDKRHHVVAPIDRSGASRLPPDISLPRPGRQEAAAALQKMGVEFERSQRLAVLGRRSLPALRRRLALDPRITRPAWAHAPDALILAPLMLVGSWTTDADDVALLEQVVNQSWQGIEPILTRMSDSRDPLLRKVGSTWTLVSSEEAFLLLHESLTKNVADRWAEGATQVLSEPDPVLDLGTDERAMAPIRGVRRRYSRTLRQGLARGLALLGAMGSEIPLDDGLTMSDLAARTVRRLLEEANADKTGRLWHQLAEVLPLLAEAAPDVFLEAVEDDLNRSRPVLLNLFQEESDEILGPSSPHPHLLWALETVCWSAEYLVDGVRVLARLASLEPGGKSANRPIASLNSILSGWIRHTSASLDERLHAIDAVYRVADEIGWKLTLELWPTDHAFVIPPAAPDFRDWKPTETSVPMSEWIAFTHAMVDRAIEHAGVDAERLAQMAQGIAAVPPDDRDRIMALFEVRVQEDMLDSEARLLLWERLHGLVARHERFATATWALPASIRTRLSDLAARLEPTSDPQRFAYLFDWHPDLPGVDEGDYEAHATRLSQLRRDALLSVLALPDHVKGLADLTRRVASPPQLGWALAELDEIVLSELRSWFSSPEPALKEAAAIWARHRMEIRGSDWFAQALREPGFEGEARLVLLCNAPPTRDTWQALRESPVKEDELTYWTTAPLEIVPLPDVSEALEHLILHKRAWTAIAVASFAVFQAGQVEAKQSVVVRPELVVKILDAAFEQKPEKAQLSTMTGYNIGQLLDYLGKNEVFEADVARNEYRFSRLLEHHREPTVLNRLLATQPEIFVDLVKRAYRRKHQPRRELIDTEREQATQAWWFLHEWKGFPGRREDSSLDASVMVDWVKAARLALSEADRSDIGDELIGEAFAHSPTGDDGVWPAEPVRDLLEGIGSRELENGIVLGKLNSRGFTTRGIYEGGHQERQLAQQYREWSKITRARWPRTGRLLRDLAESYERQARREDLEAELDADSD
jgi:excisionase family DNA binding protein